MKALAAHLGFELRAGIRNPSSLLLDYLFPLGFFALMGAVMTKINPTFTQTLVPAMAIFSVMVGAVLGLPGPLVEGAERGVFRSYRIIGVRAGAVLGVPAATTMFHTLVTAAIVTVLGPLLFGAAAPAHPLAFAAVIVASAFAFAGLGALIGVAASSGRAATLVSQAIFLPSMLLGGLMVPLSVLPESMRPVAGLLPSTYAMQAAMGFGYAQTTQVPPGIALGALVAGGTVAFALAIALFRWDGREARRRGAGLLALLALAPYVIAIVLSR